MAPLWKTGSKEEWERTHTDGWGRAVLNISTYHREDCKVNKYTVNMLNPGTTKLRRPNIKDDLTREATGDVEALNLKETVETKKEPREVGAESTRRRNATGHLFVSSFGPLG